MNKSVLVGRLTKEPELRFTPGKGTAVVNGSIAVDRDGQKDEQGNKITDFINFVAWGKTAENMANYCEKGSLVCIDGRIETRNYEAKDGSKKYVTEINAKQVEFLSTRKNGAPQGQPQNGAPQGQPQYGAPQGQPQYGAPQGQPQYGAPQGQPQYGAPQGQPQYGAPQGQPQYGAPQGQPQYGAPQGQPQYGAPMSNGYNEMDDLTPIDDSDIPF